MALDARAALIEGVSDAVAFVLGALAGLQLGRWLGFDALAGGDWNLNAVIGLAFVLLGLGAGKWAANRWRSTWRTSRRGRPD